jgi:4a-hydroxytetrahydrobiopterin dehydratase
MICQVLLELIRIKLIPNPCGKSIRSTSYYQCMSGNKFEKLSDERIREELSKLDGWNIKDGKLAKSFKFDNFVKAFGFMTQVAIEAEKMNHHPDWRNVYNSVEVSLVTHDASAITTYDIKLARIIDKIFVGS